MHPNVDVIPIPANFQWDKYVGADFSYQTPEQRFFYDSHGKYALEIVLSRMGSLHLALFHKDDKKDTYIITSPMCWLPNNLVIDNGVYLTSERRKPPSKMRPMFIHSAADIFSNLRQYEALRSWIFDTLEGHVSEITERIHTYMQPFHVFHRLATKYPDAEKVQEEMLQYFPNYQLLTFQQTYTDDRILSTQQVFLLRKDYTYFLRRTNTASDILQFCCPQSYLTQWGTYISQPASYTSFVVQPADSKHLLALSLEDLYSSLFFVRQDEITPALLACNVGRNRIGLHPPGRMTIKWITFPMRPFYYLQQGGDIRSFLHKWVTDSLIRF